MRAPRADEPQAFVVEAELELRAGCEPPAVGAAVTVDLCGHWEHDGACRWPHNSAIDAARRPARFRTIYVADASEAPRVRARIEAALRAGTEWRVVSVGARAVAASERPLAERLLAAPRAAG